MEFLKPFESSIPLNELPIFPPVFNHVLFSESINKCDMSLAILKFKW